MRCSFFFFFVSAALPLLMLLLLFPAVPVSSAFQQNPFGIVVARSRRRSCVPIFAAGDGGPSSWREGDGLDSNEWSGSGDDLLARRRDDQQPDWQDELKRKSDGSFWSAFEPSSGEEEEEGGAAAGGSAGGGASASAAADDDVDAEADAWLETLASLSAEEVQFNLKEADRADKVRQMQEWGFADETIGNTLGVATDLSLEETDDGVDAGMRAYRQESYLDEVDLEQVESHSTVEVDDETGEPVRSQMVYVDEHTCIGCTNCAMIAQSTFFMHSEHGRARVFQQWGDDDETIQVAIETCPVDCIHYVPYDELKELEVERRGQNINFKARLVSQAEFGNTLSHRVGGPNQFTAPQKISGNMGARCSNCPSRGCKDCPMYGVGKNPEYEKKEAARKARMAKRRLQEQREREQKSAEL